MSKKTDKYFYSKEEDEVLVKFVREDFLRRQKERKSIEKTWELNLNFYLGNQYSYISNLGDIGDIEKVFRWENREVFNHIAPIIECRLAKLNKIKPNLAVRPASDLEEDIYNAVISKSVLKSALEKNSIESLIMLATAWSEIAGTSFYKVAWDNSVGNIIGEKDNDKIKNGDVVISVCSPFEIFPDSASAVEVDDCESIIEARAYSAEFINSVYGLNLTGEDLEIYEMGTASVLSNLSGRINSPKVLHSLKQDNVLLIERYEKPSSRRPKGRFTIICKDKLIYDGDMPYKDMFGNVVYPFVKQVSTKQITSFWGTSVIERCIPIQRAYNAIKNKKHEYISRLASGVLTVEDGSVDVENLEDEGLAPGKILIYRNGSTPPQFLSPGSVPIELEKEEQSLLSEMNSLACVSDISINSSMPNSVSSASAISMLISQDESRLSLVAENIRVAIKKLGCLILNLYKQFADGKRISKFANCNGLVEILYWTKNQIGFDDVIFETNNELEESSVSQKEMILKLYEKGVFADDNGEVSQKIKNKVLSMLGIETFNIIEDLTEIHKSNAKAENLNAENIRNPLELDDHKIHIFEHTKYFLTSNENITNKTTKEKLLNHINIHKKLLKDEE